MRDKLLQIRVDEDFLSKLEYLQKINEFKSIAETVRKIVEKEYRKENDNGEKKEELLDYLNSELHPIVSPDHWHIYSELHDMISTL